MAASGTALIAHPSPDLYGADLQMLQTVAALVAAGWRVVVALPRTGPLVPRLLAAGAEVDLVAFPVLRKADLKPLGLLVLAAAAAAATVRLVGVVRRLRPDVVLVNTVTLPWWLLASRLTGTATLCHLHEAETEPHPLVRRLMLAPLFLAHRVIVISRSAFEAMVSGQPRLRRRAQIVYNGVPEPDHDPTPPRRTAPWQLVVVGRLSPRKAPHLALEAVGRLLAQGHDVQLTLAGTVFDGYEWYEAELRDRAARPDLANRVTFGGYRSPIWASLGAADIVLAPSLNEPFGNAVVEAQLALRPVVATASQGHLESVRDGETGLLVAAGDVEAMAAAVAHLISDDAAAFRIADRARTVALERFSVARYRAELVALVDDTRS